MKKNDVILKRKLMERSIFICIVVLLVIWGLWDTDSAVKLIESFCKVMFGLFSIPF